MPVVKPGAMGEEVAIICDTTVYFFLGKSQINNEQIHVLLEPHLGILLRVSVIRSSRKGAS